MAKQDLFKYLEAIPDISEKDWGRMFTVACPCGGKLHAKRVEGSGHLKAHCDKCGFRLIE